MICKNLNMIAIVDSEGGVSKDGKQPFFIKEDLKRFKKLTVGNTVIMGNNTFKQRGLLKKRNNIILTKNKELLETKLTNLTSEE